MKLFSRITIFSIQHLIVVTLLSLLLGSLFSDIEKTKDAFMEIANLGIVSDAVKLEKRWQSFYGYTEFVKQNTRENSTIMHPPQSNPWSLEGNQFLLRGFLFPRKFTLSDPKKIDQVDYFLLSRGLSTNLSLPEAWPYFPVPFEEIYTLNDVRNFKIISSSNTSTHSDIAPIDTKASRAIIKADAITNEFSFNYSTTDHDYWGWNTNLLLNSFTFSSEVIANTPTSISLFVCVESNESRYCLESLPNKTIDQPEKLTINNLTTRLNQLTNEPVSNFKIISYGYNFGYFRDIATLNYLGLIKSYKTKITSCGDKSTNLHSLYHSFFSCLIDSNQKSASETIDRLNTLYPGRTWYTLLTPNPRAPFTPISWHELTNSHSAKTNEERKRLLESSLKLNKYNQETHYYLGKHYEDEGKTVNALESYRYSAEGFDPIVQITDKWEKYHQLESLLRPQLKVLSKSEDIEELKKLTKLENALGYSQPRTGISSMFSQKIRIELLDFESLNFPKGSEIVQTDSKSRYHLKGILINDSGENHALAFKSTSHFFEVLPINKKKFLVKLRIKLLEQTQPTTIFCQSPIGGNYLHLDYYNDVLTMNFNINPRLLNQLRKRTYSIKSEPLDFKDNDWNILEISYSQRMEVSLNGKLVLKVDKVPIKLNNNQIYNLINCPAMNSSINPVLIDDIQLTSPYEF